MDDPTPNTPLRPRSLETILFGGLAIGVLDFIDGSTFFPLYYGITFQQVWWDLRPEFWAATLPEPVGGIQRYSEC